MKLQITIPKDDARSIEQITEHYVLEKQLAEQLRNADKEDRKHLYMELYDQLFNTIPHHPQISRKSNPEESYREVERKLKLVKPYLHADSIFLEVGPGDCQFAFEVAKTAEKVYAVDVSQEITKNSEIPLNFELILSDGCSIPVPEQSISVAYSNQLMEHLHPEDSYIQLKGIYQCLKPGGFYICITPNRLAGPHDVSKYFEPIATGFHLKEYTNQELSQLFTEVGFSRVITYMGGKGIYYRIPSFLSLWCESILSLLPFTLRYRLSNLLPIRAMLGVIIIGQK